ncbi:MAG: 3'-5' exonuclease [Bacteroidaceae bacterium]|nr:3'-5' exonuclease [Bacteroidaceae bacterium]
MKLNLTRPLVFFDIESTGLDVSKDHIVELCYIKVLPNGNEEAKNMRSRPVDFHGETVHIPEISSAIHGITDDDVKDCPSFKEIAEELQETFKGCDFAGFNSNKFDVPLLVEEFLRVGINIDLSQCHFVDVQNIYHKLERRTLAAAYKFYCGRDLENAHSADADTRATLEVLQAQLDKYPDDLQNDVKFLADFSAMNRNVDFAGRMIYDENDVEIINFGKYKGRAAKEVFFRDPGYLGWVLQGDFPLNTKQVFQRVALKYKKF